MVRVRERITSTVGEYGRNVGWYGCLSRMFATAKEYTSSGTVVVATYSRTVHTNAELSIVVSVLSNVNCVKHKEKRRKIVHSVILAQTMTAEKTHTERIAIIVYAILLNYFPKK